MKRSDENDEKNKLLKRSVLLRPSYIITMVTILFISAFGIYNNYISRDKVINNYPSRNKVIMDGPAVYIFLPAGIIMLLALVTGLAMMKKKRQIYNWIEYIEAVNDVAMHSEKVSEFIENYDEEIQNLTEFTQKYGQYTEYLGNLDLDEEKKDFQWHLREAVVREASAIVSEMNDHYAYNKEHKKQLYVDFVNEIEAASSRFEGDETWAIVEKSLTRVFRASGSDKMLHGSITNASFSRNQSPALVSGSRIDDIDGMDGPQFENWCADLMKMNGFVKVKVTPGSGDQGVDIIAEKDRVKYAIQCKNYAELLGNTPVQEIHAGKTFYNCHVGVVMTNNYFTQDAKDLAEKTGILLWDRDTIEEMMRQASL